MNIYKAPNLIISPKRKVYRSGGAGEGGALNDESIYTHIYTHTLSLSSLPLSLSLSLRSPPPHTHIHLSQCKEEKATGTGKDASLEPIWRLM